MIGQILNDITTAIRLTTEVHRARKDGASVRLQQTYTTPMLKMSRWGRTMESCLLVRDSKLNDAVSAVFCTFDSETQHALTFSPKNPGDWAERAQMWRQELKPVLSAEEYYAAMSMILGWYIHCVRRRATA